MAAFVILHDTTLRDLARLRPATLEALRVIRGLGEKKIADFGARLIERIAAHEREKPPAANPDGRSPSG